MKGCRNGKVKSMDIICMGKSTCTVQYLTQPNLPAQSRRGPVEHMRGTMRRQETGDRQTGTQEVSW